MVSHSDRCRDRDTLPRAPRAIVVAVVLPCACAQCCGTTAINYPTPKSFREEGAGTRRISRRLRGRVPMATRARLQLEDA